MRLFSDLLSNDGGRYFYNLSSPPAAPGISGSGNIEIEAISVDAFFTPPTLSQVGFRFYNDDGVEA